MSEQTQPINKLRRFVDCEKEDFHLRSDAPDFKCGLYAVHQRHVDVEENEVGLQFDDLLDGFLAVLSLTAHLKTMPIQKRTDGGSCR